MSYRKSDRIPYSEITPEAVYHDRRKFLALGATAAMGALLGCARNGDAAASAEDVNDQPGQDELTPYEDATSYNNYYEFGTDKADPKRNSQSFQTRPWTVRVDGLVKRPVTYDLDDLLRPHPSQERVYRLRCVEAWSMVIPWMGFSLGDLVRRLEPLPSARFVELTTLHDPARMPGQRRPVLDWPYVEGLRMDEALNPLSILATGMYGKPLPNQNGAPLRLVVPWKYGFKSVKGIVRIRFTDSMPSTSWAKSAPNEYGFYANVNPTVAHPRWSQARERRVGEWRRRPTLLFNGYGEQVASMYSGMDLRANF